MTSCSEIQSQLSGLSIDISELSGKFISKNDFIALEARLQSQINNLQQQLNNYISTNDSRLSKAEQDINNLSFLKDIKNFIEGLINGLKDLTGNALEVARNALTKALDALGEALQGKAMAADVKTRLDYAEPELRKIPWIDKVANEARDVAGDAIVDAGEAIRISKPIPALVNEMRGELAVIKPKVEELEVKVSRAEVNANEAKTISVDAKKEADRAILKTIELELKVSEHGTAIHSLEALYLAQKIKVETAFVTAGLALAKAIALEFKLNGDYGTMVDLLFILRDRVYEVNARVDRLETVAYRTMYRVDTLDGKVSIALSEINDIWLTLNGLELRIRQIKPTINNIIYEVKPATTYTIENTIIKPIEYHTDTIIEKPYPVPQPIYLPTREIHTIELQPIIKPTVNTIERIVEKPYPVPQPIYNTVVINSQNTIREVLPLQTINTTQVNNTIQKIETTIVQPTEIRTLNTNTIQTRVEKIIKDDMRFVKINVPVISCEKNDEGVWTATTNTTQVDCLANETGNNSAEVLAHYTRIADLAKFNCESKNGGEGECYVAVPDMWLLRPEHHRSQVIYQFAEVMPDGKTGSPKYSITIPHHKPDKPESKLPNYKRGNWEFIYVLKDNSKITLHTLNEAECKSLFDVIKALIIPQYLEGAYISKNSEIEPKEPLALITVKNTKATYYSKGRKNGKPDWLVKF